MSPEEGGIVFWLESTEGFMEEAVLELELKANRFWITETKV